MDEPTPRFVSVSGGYWTGASAVIDLLSEHPDCRVLPEEFTLFSFGQIFEELSTGRLMDMGARGTPPTSLERLRQFNRPDVLSRARGVARRICTAFGVYPPFLHTRRLGMARRLGSEYASACEELVHFLENGSTEATRLGGLFTEVLKSATLGGDAKASDAALGVFDQLVAPPFARSAAEHVPTMLFVNVDRGWQDQYISFRDPCQPMVRKNLRLGVSPWGEPAESFSWTPTEYFLWLRGRIEAAKAEGSHLPQKVLWVQFEDLVRHPEREASRIFAFLGLEVTRWRPGQRFDPAVSRQRIDKPLPERFRREVDVIASQLADMSALG